MPKMKHNVPAIHAPSTSTRSGGSESTFTGKVIAVVSQLFTREVLVDVGDQPMTHREVEEAIRSGAGVVLGDLTPGRELDDMGIIGWGDSDYAEMEKGEFLSEFDLDEDLWGDE